MAESTGKEGLGILPIVGEEWVDADEYPDDRFFVAILLRDEETPEVEDRLRALEEKGHPVATIRLRETLDLGVEIYRWQVAVGAGGVDSGDQPVLSAGRATGQAPGEGCHGG